MYGTFKTVKGSVLASLLLAGTLLFVGCSGEEDLPTQPLIEIPDDLSDYQREILDDFVVSDAEYLRAVQDARLCVENKGYTVGAIETNIFTGTWMFGVQYPVGETETEAQQRRKETDSCTQEHSNFVERYWISQLRPQGAERERVFQQLISCLENYGITGVTSSFTDNQVVDAIWRFTDGDDDLDAEIFTECYFPHYTLFYE